MNNQLKAFVESLDERELRKIKEFADAYEPYLKPHTPYTFFSEKEDSEAPKILEIFSTPTKEMEECSQ